MEGGGERREGKAGGGEEGWRGGRRGKGKGEEENETILSRETSAILHSAILHF